MLFDVEHKGRTFRRLNELNRRYRVAKLTWHASAVATVELVPAPFVPALVREAGDAPAAVTADIDHIATRVGGARHDGA